MSFWYDEVYEDVRYGLSSSEIVFDETSDYQRVQVIRTERFGRALVLDGVFNTSEGDEHYYHEMMAHPALACAAAPRDVLVIGGGDGGTAREALRHPGVERVVMLEIDELVVRASREHLPGLGAWDDPRLELRIGDGLAFARDAAPESFDAVLLDATDPVGPAEGLFGGAFFADVARILRPGGAFAMQSESPILMRSLWREIQRALAGVFATARPYFGPVPIYASGIWSWTLCGAGDLDPLAPELERVAAVERGTRYYNRDIHRAAFALPNELRRR